MTRNTKAAIKRVRECMQYPCDTERRLMHEIQELLSMKIPIALSRMAVCHPIATLGSAGDGAPFREVVDVTPYLTQLMNIQAERNIAIEMVLKFVAPSAIRSFSQTPTVTYWMNIQGSYNFPQMTALSMTSTFSPWDSGGTTCVYSVSTQLTGPGHPEVVYVPTHLVQSNVLPLYLIRYSVTE